MILQALNQYYERLADDPQVEIAPFGFSRQQIAFCVTLNADGSLHAIEDIRDASGKKPAPRSLVVLGNAKPSGSGINPGFLWDNTAYMLGYKADDDKPKRTADSFEAFRQRHLDVDEAIGDPEFSAVCHFLKSWQPVNAAEHKSLIDIATGFGVFRIRAANHYVHEQKAVRSWWQNQIKAADSKASDNVGQCLVSGAFEPLARLHEPKIKGVWGAQSAGAAIVSFNLDAFESYGKQQSLNSPVSERAAFQYCTALNHLLRSGSPQRIQLGDASVIFWTAKPTEAENILPWVFDPTKTAEDEALKKKTHATLEQVAKGSYPGDWEDPQTPFYVLGLSPNAARVAVRFWWCSTLKDVLRNLQRHFADLQIIRSERDPQFPALWQLLRETSRESKDIPPLLAGALLRAVLTGSPYPSMLFSSIVRRTRADQEISYMRAAILKAYLNRNTCCGIHPLKQEIHMSLDPDRPEPSYHIGRFFAELEKAQEEALPGLNATIKDRYFSAASATPNIVFPRLIRLSQHHLGKLEVNKRVYREKRIQEILAKINQFPAHLNLQHQGLFAIGYYHQRQDIYSKKTSNNDKE